MPPPGYSNAVSRSGGSKPNHSPKTAPQNVVKSPYLDPVWACSMCFHSDNVVVHAVCWGKPTVSRKPKNQGPRGYYNEEGVPDSVERMCIRCRQSWRPIQVAPSVVEGKWMQVRRPRINNSTKTRILPRFNMWDPSRGGMYKYVRVFSRCVAKLNF